MLGEREARIEAIVAWHNHLRYQNGSALMLSANRFGEGPPPFAKRQSALAPA